jgi:hypothetical protein
MQNPDGAQWCAECGTRLPTLEETVAARPPAQAPPFAASHSAQSASIPQQRRSTPPNSSNATWWQKLSPDWKGAIVFGLGWLILSFITTSTGGAGCIFSYPILTVVCLGQGAFVARQATQDSRYTPADHLKLGLFSSLWTLLLEKMFAILIAVLLIGGTFGGALVALPTLIIAQLGSIVIQVGATGLGAWLYGRSGDKNRLGFLAAVGAGAVALVCVLMAIATALLAVIGIPLLEQLTH